MENVPEASSSAGTLNPQGSDFQEALQSLSQSNLTYLLSSKRPVLSTDPMHHTPSQPIVSSDNFVDALSIILEMQNEILLMASLQEAQKTTKNLQHQVIDLQASNILNKLYCNKLRFQLAYKEEKKGKDSERGKLISDGLPKMLTSNEFHERIVEFTRWQKEKEVEKEVRKKAGEEYQEELMVWKMAEEERKKKNDEIKEKYHEAVITWEKQKDEAKKAGKS